MEEVEVPTEQLHEQIKEEVEKSAHGPGHAHAHGDGLPLRVALSSALIAVVAAIAALLAGHHANEAMIEQMEVTDQWSFYQAKSIKATVLASTNEILTAVGKAPRPGDAAKLEAYKGDLAAIEEKAHEKEKATETHRRHYKTLAYAVTLSQVSIALAAMAVLTRKKALWFGSLALGLSGAFFLLQGLL